MFLEGHTHNRGHFFEKKRGRKIEKRHFYEFRPLFSKKRKKTPHLEGVEKTRLH